MPGKFCGGEESIGMEALLSPAGNGFLLIAEWPLGLSCNPASKRSGAQTEQKSPRGGIKEVQKRKAFCGVAQRRQCCWNMMCKKGSRRS